MRNTIVRCSCCYRSRRSLLGIPLSKLASAMTAINGVSLLQIRSSFRANFVGNKLHRCKSQVGAFLTYFLAHECVPSRSFLSQCGSSSSVRSRGGPDCTETPASLRYPRLSRDHASCSSLLHRRAFFSSPHARASLRCFIHFNCHTDS